MVVLMPKSKEVPMQYKTIALELIQDRPKMYDQLLSTRKLLSALELHANELQAIHQAWMERLRQMKPHSDASQIASEALELALEQMERLLARASLMDETESLSLDAAMAFIKHPTSPA